MFSNLFHFSHVMGSLVTLCLYVIAANAVEFDLEAFFLNIGFLYSTFSFI